mgnify:CR=1 FL=1
MVAAASRPQKFLSTPSARRATLSAAVRYLHQHISIHALREEGDMTSRAQTRWPKFLSTPSARRATHPVLDFAHLLVISIHALREEGDQYRPPWSSTGRYFYPRPPRGGRPRTRRTRPSPMTFLSTPSARRATERPDVLLVAFLISIHALREEGDSKNGEKHLRFCFIIKRSAQIWKSLSKNIRKNSCDLHRTA